MTTASGKVNGLVASRNRGGNYFRGLTIPTNPNTPAQVAARMALATWSSGWTDLLTTAQRSAWNDYAATLTYTNALGDPIQISGQNAFISANTVLSQVGGAAVADAPAPSAAPSFAIDGVTVTASTGAIAFNIKAAPDNAWAYSDDNFLAVYASRDCSPGKTFFGGPFRYADSIEGDTTTPPVGAASVTSPFTHVVGAKVFLRLRVVDVFGRLSPVEITKGNVVV